MYVSLRGGLFIYVVTVACFSAFFPVGLIPAVLLGVTKHMFMALMTILLECVLQLRLSYTIVSKRSEKMKKNDKTSPKLTDIFTAPKYGKFKIIFLNHRTCIDWLVLYPFLARTNMMSSLRIVLKNELSSVPIFGWSTQFFRYIFLTRKWDKDEESMRQMVDYFKRTNDGGTIVIFPEGTDLSKNNIAKSQAYATQHGLPVFHYVLNPRATGLVSLINMIGVENIEELVDVTMGYTDYDSAEVPSEVSVVNGRMPPKVHILCTRHPLANGVFTEEDGEGLFMDNAPTGDAKLRDWINDHFAMKEILLSHFYASNPVGFEAHNVRSVFGEDTEVTTYDEDEDAMRNADSTKFSRFTRDVGLWRGFIGVVAFWSVPVMLWIWYGTVTKLVFYVLCFLACFWVDKSKGSLQKYLLFSAVKNPASLKQD